MVSDLYHVRSFLCLDIAENQSNELLEFQQNPCLCELLTFIAEIGNT